MAPTPKIYVWICKKYGVTWELATLFRAVQISMNEKGKKRQQYHDYGGKWIHPSPIYV